MLEARIITALKNPFFLVTLTPYEKSSSLQFLISVFPNNKDLQDIAIQEIFDKDMIFIRRNKNDAQKDKFLEARLIRTLNKNIPNSIGQKNIFFNKFSKADKCSTIYILLSTFPSSYQLQDFALNQMQQRWLSSQGNRILFGIGSH